ncbi:MAG: hypothetical protein J0M02_00180 [Planctomycetes bacterium]|nr:hypothetical protein [Planctomycetota bacterium]
MLSQSRTLYAFEREMFERMEGLSLSLDEPSPDRQNPIIAAGPAGGPDDGKICYTGSVLPWRGGYGMWYQAEDRNRKISRCWARSPDGLTWERLGAISGEDVHESGNSFNVCSIDGRLLSPLTVLETLQPHQVPDARRRALAERQMSSGGRRGITSFVGLAHSTDGAGWTTPGRSPVIPMKLETPRLYRFQGRFIMNGQSNGAWFEPPHPSNRIVAFFSSDDLVSWRTHPVCMVNQSHAATAGQTHCGIVPIKCIDDRMLIGLGGRFDDAADLCDQHFDITLLYSYDGIDWRPAAPELAHRSWIRRGRTGDWDAGGVVAMGMTENGEDAAVYFHGTAIGNCSHSFPFYDPGACAIGRVRFGKDRFASLRPTVGWNAYALKEVAGAHGSITTRPIEHAADHPFRLNVDIPAGTPASVIIDVLAADGTVYDTARVAHGGVSVHIPFSQRIPAGRVRLRLTMTGGQAPDTVPRLFAISY